MPDLSNTDIKLVIRYLTDAALLYDTHTGLRYTSRAWVIRRLVRKLNVKLSNNSKP